MKKVKTNKIKYVKIITLVCLIILVMELSFMLYKVFYTSSGDVYFDTINSIIKVNDGFISVGGNNDNEMLYEKAKVTIYDKNKETVVEKLYNKGISSTYNSVCSDGNDIVVVGNFSKSKKDYENDYTKALIVKYDKDGEIVWEKSFEDADKSSFNKIKKVNDYYIVVGQSLFEKENKSLIGGAYIIKYDKNGNIIWQQRYGNNSMARFNDFVVLNDKIYVVGKNNEDLGILVSFDMDGNLINEESYEGASGIGFSGVVDDNEEFLYVVGSKNDKGLIVKYDIDTDFRLDSVYEAKEKSRFNRIIRDSNNELVVIGLVKTSKSNIHNGIIAKYNTSLEKVGGVVKNNENDEYFTDLLLEDNNYLVVGYSLYDDNYLGKFTLYSDALKELGVS